ncbi:MAG: NAD(P)H-dependent oxidoreductase subunit E [Methylacidiphilales bacterium]|nr:NAD(P)H-dependent oxidoreductase subunit E [Candidatus Methylacidiphilales bacterium]
MHSPNYNAFVDELLTRTGCGPEATIPILQCIQREYRHLPEPALQHVSEITGIRLADLIGVATFYHQFRLGEAGRHTMRVCHGTACHVKGSENIDDHIHRQLKISDGHDTSPNNEFTVERVACLGCCTLAPVVKVDHTTYGRLTSDTINAMVEDFQATRHKTIADVDTIPGHLNGKGAEIRVGLGSCCMAKGSDKLFHQLRRTVKDFGIDASVKRVGCVGMCHQTPFVEVRLPGRPAAFYGKVDPDEAAGIVRRHFRPMSLRRRIVRWTDRTLEQLVTDGNDRKNTSGHALNVSEKTVAAFNERQVRIATEGLGEMDPLDLDEHIAHQGFTALRRVLGSNPEEIISTITQSGLRGRGGAGFPTGEKWARARAALAPDGVKYVIVNGDEGDPGAFMDGMLMESFPYRVIEGMLIAACCIGSTEGYIYVRAEYPRSVARLRAAIAKMEERGFLGTGIMGGNFNFKLRLFEGAGAFVCGEETALIESIEGKRGVPRMKPPYPADCGLWQRPTLINNVETFAMVPWIIRNGARAFAAHGTEKSKGTKVFSLAGKISRAALIEVPMGITIREIVEDIGGGMANGRQFKAVQIGGPSGGCIPAALDHTPVDYEALTAAGAIMGSGGMIVLDEDDCMVDMARYFITFLRDESCGQCTFCRIGTMRMYEILDKLCQGKGRSADLDELLQLASLTTQGSICGLGRSAPNPVLTTLRYFRNEYEAHIAGRCPAGKCKPLIQYVVQDNCTGCTICAQHCPVNAIPMTPYSRHQINTDLCTRCDVCRADCPENAITIMSGGIKCHEHSHKEPAPEALAQHE